MSTSPASARRFVLTTNNAYDTLLMVEGDKVVSAWEMTDSVVTEYLACKGDCRGWEANFPENEAVEDYGQEMTDAEFAAKVEARLA